MEIQPQSNIKLLHNVPLDTSYDHTIYFATATAQYNYFAGLTKYNLTNQSYQRVNKGKARVAQCADNIYDCNYMMFQNTAFGTKWFYAYITAIEYVNNETSEIEFEIDPIQTWFFDFTIDQCFVEREHPVSDAKFSNLVPENLELGDYTVVQSNAFDMNSMGIAMLASKHVDSSGNVTPPTGNVYNNIYTPLELQVALGNTAQDGQNLTDNYVNNGQEDAIVAMWQFPLKFGMANPSYETFSLAPQPSTIDGYTPKNNKLFSYPFSMIVGTNWNGQTAEYRWEQWSSGDEGKFWVSGTGMGEASAIMYPINYRGKSVDYDSGITFDNFPTVPIVGDAFKAFWAQNQSKIKASLGMGVAGVAGTAALIGAGLLTGGAAIAMGAGAIGAGLGAVLGANGKIEDTKRVPPQVANQGQNPYLAAGMHKLGFELNALTIRSQFARVIDDYFTKFGYATHRVKVPNTHSRPHWNYVKTISSTITGSIPADDMKKICQLLDNGITFWKNGSEIGNYSLDNRPT